MHAKIDATSQGLMPDSAAHIARLESKLKKMKKLDQNKVTGKDLLSSMHEFKDIYMNDFFKSDVISNKGCSSNEITLENVDKTYLERKLLPEQPINKEEILNLVENDWLVKSDNDDENCLNEVKN
jgi:hypothetical protein